MLAMLLLPLSAASQVDNIPNPVLPGVADAGVMKYNGRYYIGGVRTDGDFYHSSDLVEWQGPIHVLSMDNDWTRGTGAGDNQIHANHMIHIDGTFHLYWSVNHWGDDRHIVHVAHAESDSVLGPYVEPVKDTWMDNRIDPMVFRDDDGRLYMYMVRFTDGNTIWVRPMKDARTFVGPPLYQYASLPGTWERMDNRVIEGPWVIRYRDRYYMMFNGNHTGTDWGNYQLGVAEADSPMAFNNGTKYPYPLLGSNQTALQERSADLLLFSGEDHDPLFRYTVAVPGDGWRSAGFDDSGWSRGRGAFASQRVTGSTVRRQGTVWDSDAIYVRKTFRVADGGTGNLALRVHHDAPTRVYLNGEVIYDGAGTDYRTVNLTAGQRGLLGHGANVLAVESVRGRRGGFLDVSLFDVGQDTADDILYSPGQPNIVRGPNGFEWWLVYMANKNREPRSQYINRLYFFDRTMYADNVTSTATEGYFPVPSKPTFADAFDDGDLEGWSFTGERWSVAGGEMRSPAGKTEALLDGELKASAYLFEVGVNGSGEAGVVAWRRDGANWLHVGLDNSSGRRWYTEMCLDGEVSRQTYPMPDFKPGVYHTIAVERNYDRVTVRVDDLTRTGAVPLVFDGLKGEGVPGLFADGGAAFDGVCYTVGWDEFDGGVAGWETLAGGGYGVAENGLKAVSDAPSAAMKGDALSDYEYSLQTTVQSDGGKAGIYAAWVDEKNHVSALIDYAARQLVVTVTVDGRVRSTRSYPMYTMRTLYADMRFTDSMEKGYTFTSPTWIDQLWLSRVATENDFHGTVPQEGTDGRGEFIDNMWDRFDAEYLFQGKWRRFESVRGEVAPNPAYRRTTFDPVKAEALRFINRDPHDQRAYIYTIRAGEIVRDSYNIRGVRCADEILLFVDGRQICTVPAPGLGKARVGVLSEGCRPLYNGIQCYDTSRSHEAPAGNKSTRP